MEFTTQSDEQLMNAVADGEDGQLDELLRRYQQRLLHFLARLCGEQEAAKELFCRSFASIYRARRLYDPSIRFSTLLFGTAFSQAKNFLGSDPGALALTEKLPTENTDPLSLEARDFKIRKAMIHLPLEQRAALHLCLFDNLGFFETAQCLQLSEAETRLLVDRGFQRLRDSLGPDFIRGAG